MKILILGGDGYLGWPTCMHFAALGHDVTCVDNYYRRTISASTDSDSLFLNPNLMERASVFKLHTGNEIKIEIGDCCDAEWIKNIVATEQPDVIVHYAEQPSAPYSMSGFRQARDTLFNNLGTTFNIIWAMIEHAPAAHLIKLGTMGEYGTPNIDIEEGWLDVEHKGRSQKFLYPRQAGSLYHTSKVLDTDLLWFYVRTYDLKVTDLMQGPVYGYHTDQTVLDKKLWTNFHYDDIFGTVLNRFIVQAVAGVPLTVYGKGLQTRGYLNLVDTLKCIEISADESADAGELRIMNQFTETFSVNELANLVKCASAELGIDVNIQNIPNPRKEAEEHYYNVTNTALENLGLEPTLLSVDVLKEMIGGVMEHKNNIAEHKIFPRVRWNN